MICILYNVHHTNYKVCIVYNVYGIYLPSKAVVMLVSFKEDDMPNVSGDMVHTTSILSF